MEPKGPNTYNLKIWLQTSGNHVPDPGAVEHPGAAPAEQEEVECGHQGSQGALGVSDESQYFESSLEIENNYSSV